MSAYLEREHFTVSQEDRYFTLEGLSKMIGQEANQWRHAALKELLDNALDAAESVYPATTPCIAVEISETSDGLTLTVADNGPGISTEQVAQITQFNNNSGTKIGYRAPTRGAQGNAAKTLIGIPVALGYERGGLEIEAQGLRHTIHAWLTPIGPRKDHQQEAIDTQETRVTVYIPGPVECYRWEPARWIIAYGLFNPHAQIQIRKIDPISPPADEIDDGQRAYKAFSGMSLAPTVSFPDPWRKFLPTDPTPAHWYSAEEFRRLVHLKHSRRPNQLLSDFVQEFKGLSRAWRKVCQSLPTKTLAELVDHPPAIPDLHRALRSNAKAPEPETLGRVGPDHFRQRFDEHFTIKRDSKGHDRYWYKHQWAMDGDTPYLIEVAIAETEQAGDVFYGLNYSVPFADPLANTRLLWADPKGKEEPIEGQGLAGFLREAGVYCGARYGKSVNTVSAVHLVMPLLPTLDMGKTRMAISDALARAIAHTIATAAKTLHKEIVDARLRQKRLAQQERQQSQDAWITRRRDEARWQRQQEEEADKAQRQKAREERQEHRAQEAERRRLRGALPTKQDVVFKLIPPTYLSATEQETIYISRRDFYYETRPPYGKHDVLPSTNRDGSENRELDYDYFSTLVARYNREIQPLPMIDCKARGTLFEPHTGREIPVGDRELRTYEFPRYQYAGILVIEKEGVWTTLKDTGGVELARKYDLLVLSLEGYNIEAGQKLLAKGQQEHGYKIFCWHDADPHGYNICRVLAEPTERLPNHHLDVIDIGLRLEEGLEMGLQTETFTRANALPKEILPGLSDKELEFFTGTYDEGQERWRNCQRIEINAIPKRERPVYLDKKLSAFFQKKPADPSQPTPPESRPPIADMLATGAAMVHRQLKATTRATIEERIDLDAIEAATLATLPRYDLAEALQTALDADAQTPWREIVKQTTADHLAMAEGLPAAIERAVDAAIRAAVSRWMETAP